MRNWSFWIVYISVFSGILLLFWTARRNLEKRWVRILFGRMYGPRTDVKYMTRRDLFQSALSFLFWSIVSLFLCIFIIYLAGVVSKGGEFPTVGLVGLFAFVLFSGVGVTGALYLFIRGLLRDKDFVPPQQKSE